IFAERFGSLLKEKEIRQVELCRMAEERGMKLGKSQISQYVSGKTLPRVEILQDAMDRLEDFLRYYKQKG
ncbi:MAG: hypothetical protein IKT43_03355, partial [Clostridia bacterium]|nr:hypothetical protein [Clostridia bacterium]